MTNTLASSLRRWRAAALLCLAAGVSAPALAGLLNVIDGVVSVATSGSAPASITEMATSGTFNQVLPAGGAASALSVSQTAVIGASSFTAHIRTAAELGLGEVGVAQATDVFTFLVGPGGLDFVLTIGAGSTAPSDSEQDLVAVLLQDSLTLSDVARVVAHGADLGAGLTFSGTLPEGEYQFAALVAAGRSQVAQQSGLPVAVATTLDVSLQLFDVGGGDPGTSVPEPASAALVLLSLALGRQAQRRRRA